MHSVLGVVKGYLLILIIRCVMNVIGSGLNTVILIIVNATVTHAATNIRRLNQSLFVLRVLIGIDNFL